MLSKKNRFHGNGSVRRVLGRGTSIRGKNMSMRYFESKIDIKVAVIVSKKISKSAVVRNRIRRRVFEAVRLQSIKNNNLLKGEYIFLVHNVKLETTPYADIENEVKGLLNKATPNK